MREPLNLSEEETEALLVTERRYLPLPDGGSRLVTVSRLTWLNYDIVVEEKVLAPVEISETVMFRMRRDRTTFEVALSDVLYELRLEANRRMQEQIDRIDRTFRVASAKLRSAFKSAASPAAATVNSRSVRDA